MKIQMKAYRSLKNGRYFELGRHGIVWYPVIDPASIGAGKSMPTLVALDHKLERNSMDGHDVGQVEEVIFSCEFEQKKYKNLLCNKCGGELKEMKACSGDPDGIRHDLQCKKCKTIYGQSRTRLFEIRE